MTKRKMPTDEEIALFRRSVGPVRKLGNDRIGPAGRTLPPRPRPRHEPVERAAGDDFSDHYDPGQVTPQESLFFMRPGLQQRLVQRLRRGQLAIGAILDMHGMTTNTARTAIMDFIAESRAQGIRCALIVHGKGYGAGTEAPVLKNRLNSWLRQHHDVLAFSSATPRDGGTGALYVLLRTQRK